MNDTEARNLDKVKIKEGLEGAGRMGVAIRPDILVNNIWYTPVKWDDTEEPSFVKTCNLLFKPYVFDKAEFYRSVEALTSHLRKPVPPVHEQF